MLDRRDVLKLGALSGAAALMPVARVAAEADGSSDVPPLALTPFTVDLPIPQPARPRAPQPGDRPDTDYYDFYARRGRAEVVPRTTTELWAYSDSPVGPVSGVGPTLVGREGRAIVVTHHNVDVPHALSVHHHGAVVDGDSDGHPFALFSAGQSFTYALPNQSRGARAAQTARTMWYHDHAIHHTGENVYQGLAGLFLQRDASKADALLPQGDFDIPLVLTDRLMDRDGNLLRPRDGVRSKAGLLGNVQIVNGAPQPRVDVAAARYRFRILNGSSARQYDLAFSDGRAFQVIATEGGFLPAPLTVRRLFVAQAERYEIVVDLRDLAGGSVTLLNQRAAGLMRLLLRLDHTRATPADDRDAPAALRAIDRIGAAEVTVRRHFVFGKKGGRWTVNGRIFDPDRFDAEPVAGTTELWTLENEGGGWVHPIHVHLVNFQIVTRNGRPPGPLDMGWKETTYLGPDHVVQVIMTWPTVPDDVLGRPDRGFHTRYVFHCHNLEHEDDDMMLQIRVRS